MGNSECLFCCSDRMLTEMGFVLWIRDAVEDPACQRDDDPDLASEIFSNQLPGHPVSFLDHQQSSLTLYCLCIEFNGTDWGRNVAACWG